MKTSRGRELLTENQRNELMQIPADRWILGSYYTFSEQDLAIILKRRREDNRLGFAVQLAVLRYPGWSYTHLKSIPPSNYCYVITNQYPSSSHSFLWAKGKYVMESFRGNSKKVCGYQEFTSKEYRQLSKHLLSLALENGDSSALLNASFDYYANRKSFCQH